ncbi:DUF2931 family protein [Candidatus Pantoea floridensis]|uniref:DUF2931 family protein n=1 Tax=Candidatus Pantoea floridensis TaxID=1938870 RepID=A0A286DMF6_9GAMM|nr:DUF2931 family protein [Pantoea floridensis]PIF14669.1 Protein of unknown function (DUF2931) [Enterobacteriaceae bacterium JKS000233]SOD59811.1 Protein of unknown function [Pantoea floridensis]
MEIIRKVALLSILLITACHSAGNPNAIPLPKDLPTQWNFNFFTPRALPALVTFAAILDADGYNYRFNTLNSTPDLSNVIGEWNDIDRAPSGYWNHLEHPPKHILFCWDSVIDKKVYETHLTLSDATINKMRRPSEHKDYQGNIGYYDTIQIGLGPEGKVAVWLRGIGNEPNYRVRPSVLKTVSGEKLALCKGITKHPNGYKYYGDTSDFIKGKKYPYGNW